MIYHYVLNENIARVSDILERISKLNEMIDFYKTQSGEKICLNDMKR